MKEGQVQKKVQILVQSKHAEIPKKKCMSHSD